jgi:hypothetical protein
MRMQSAVRCQSVPRNGDIITIIIALHAAFIVSPNGRECKLSSLSLSLAAESLLNRVAQRRNNYPPGSRRRAESAKAVRSLFVSANPTVSCRMKIPSLPPFWYIIWGCGPLKVVETNGRLIQISDTLYARFLQWRRQ